MLQAARNEKRMTESSKGVQIVPEGRFQAIDITFVPPPNPGVLDTYLGEEVRPGPLNPHCA